MPDSTSALVNQLANPPSPFDMLQKGVGAVTALKDYQAKQAIANAYTQAIDPDTGQVDQGKFNQLMRGGAASWAAGPAMQQQGQAQGAQGTGTQNWVAAQRDQLNLLNGYVTPLLQRANAGQPVSADDVHSVLNNAVGITPQMRQAVETKLASLPPGADASGLLKGFQFATQSGGEQASRLYPTIGQNISMQQWLQEPFAWDDRGGVHRVGTKGDYYSSMGLPVPNLATMPAGSPPPATGVPPPPASGGANASAAGGATGATGPVSSVTTGRTPVAQPPPVPPSTAAMSPEQVKAGRDAYTADQALQSTLGSRLGPLSSALSVLRANPNMETVGQDEINQLTQVAHAFGFPVGDLNQSNAYQELSKNLEQYLRALPGANRSDLAQTQAGAASPHIGQGRGAMEDLLAKAVGYERLRAAGVDYFNSQYGDAATASNNAAQYKNKTTSWLASQDPVAYATDHMTPQMYANYVKGLSASDKTKFINSRKEALKLYPTLTLPGSSASPPLSGNQPQQQP